MRIVISNFSAPVEGDLDFRDLWQRTELPPAPSHSSLFEQPVDWGFHLYAIGLYLMDLGVADRVEFWDYRPDRRAWFLGNGVLKVTFLNERDVAAYLEWTGPPDLILNHGWHGVPVLQMLEGQSFRVHVPTLRLPDDGPLPQCAECFMVDAEEQVEDRCMLYIPVVHTEKIRPIPCAKERDFIYLAFCYAEKRHDLLIDAIRGTELTGHFHPVGPDQLDLTGTQITTSNLDERDVVELLQTSRIAVYAGDRTSNPAAMWECVAAGLPIVMNEDIAGGKHLVVPGVTGEFASAETFADTMRMVLKNRDSYRPREYFEATWDTITLIERYLDFFKAMGWNSS